MSLLGRLEDLPITDILQIVFLSRRTGILEIVRGTSRSQVLFQRGLIVGARSSEITDLGQQLLGAGKITESQLAMAKQAAATEPVTPLGVTLTELSLISPDDLGEAIVSKIRRVIEPLVGCEDGEFNFILREALDAVEIEYQPDDVFRDKGVSPQKILAKDGERIVPLRALQDQMRTGKLLMSQRGMSVDESRRERESQMIPVPLPPAAPASSVEPQEVKSSPAAIGLPSPEPPKGAAVSLAPPAPRPTLEFSEITPTEEDLASIGPLQLEESSPDSGAVVPSVSVIIAGGEEERRKAFEDRTVVILESDPLVRVAVKRILAKKGMRVFHFNDPAEVLRTVRELYDQEKFFVTILGFPEGTDAANLKDSGAVQLLDFVRKLGRGYPAIAILAKDDHNFRREVFRSGADVVITKPPARPGGAASMEADLSSFGEELTILAERYHSSWDLGQAEEEPERKRPGSAISELGRKERGRRTLAALKHLIAELAGTTEVTEVALMILRVAGEYLERGVLFLVGPKEFVGLGGFGVTGDGVPMNLRVRRIRIPISEPTIFSDVRRNRRTHRGKLKKTDWNQKLIVQLGTIYPNEVVAIPVVNRDRVLAIVYGDNARDKVPIVGVDGLEIFLAQAGYAFEAALSAGRKRRTAVVAGVDTPDGDDAPRGTGGSR